jgi:microcystin-dependent protein
MTMKYQAASLFLATILTASFGCGGGNSSPSPDIAASVPNAQGMGIVSGKSGSVQGNSEVTVSSTNPPSTSDCSQASVQSAPDGSFSVTVCDHPGEKLYVFDSSSDIRPATAAGVEVVVATVQVP